MKTIEECGPEELLRAHRIRVRGDEASAQDCIVGSECERLCIVDRLEGRSGYEHAAEQLFTKSACEKQIVMETSTLVLKSADEAIELARIPHTELGMVEIGLYAKGACKIDHRQQMERVVPPDACQVLRGHGLLDQDGVEPRIA